MDAVTAQLDRIEAKLDDVLRSPIINLTEVMRLTGCQSRTAQHRWNQQTGLKPYVRGKYRRLEVENKIAHLRLFPAKKSTPSASPV